MINFAGICKAKDLIKSITFAWYNIGKEWRLDEKDIELFSLN